MRKIRTKRRAKVSKPIDGLPAPCPLCDRPMVTGPSLDQHHPLPRSHGGRETVTMHKICHRAIHAMLSEQELAEEFTELRNAARPPAAGAVHRLGEKAPAGILRPHPLVASRRFK